MKNISHKQKIRISQFLFLLFSLVICYPGIVNTQEPTEVNLKSLYFEGASFKFKNLSIRSTEAVTCSFDFQRTSTEIELQTDKATSFSFSSENKPKKYFFLNGASFRSWQYDVAVKIVSLKLTAGRHELSVIKQED